MNQEYKIRLRQACKIFAFDSIRQTQLLTNAWMWIYNNERPHSGLQYYTPVAFLLKYGKLEKEFLSEA